MRQQGLPLHFHTRSGRCTVVGKFVLQHDLVMHTGSDLRQYAERVCVNCRFSCVVSYLIEITIPIEETLQFLVKISSPAGDLLRMKYIVLPIAYQSGCALVLTCY